MAVVNVTYSETHPVRIPLIEEALSEHTVDPLEVEPGPFDPAIEPTDVADDVGALVVRPGAVPRRVFENAPALEVVAVHGSGYGRVDLEAATEHDVVVTHNPGGTGPAVAEHALGMMLALLRDFPGVAERTNAGEWNAARRKNVELDRQTVGIVGLGTIGFDLAQRLSNAFDADLLGYDPYVTGQRESSIYPRVSAAEVRSAGIELTDLETLLDRSDIVSLHTPLTADTAGLIGEDELRRLTDGYLVNTARGGVVDENALARAVEEDRLAGVALDVLDAEPPDSEHPLLRSPEVLITPHIAAATEGYLERAAKLSAEKIDTVFGGVKPETTVNPEVFE